MKKFVAVLSAAAMMTSLAACGYTADTANTAASSAETTASAAETTADTAAADSYKVAIVQQLDHASLDEIRVAIEKELDAKAAEKGITIEYKDFNGQNDATTLNQIGTQVVADGYDAIIPIATLAAQCMTTAAESTKTPVIYAAISDPAAADLTDIDYVTGTSDALNTQSIMDMMFAAQPDIQTVGLLYSNSEANSTTPIAEAKAYLDAKGIAYVEKTGNTNDEIMTAASSMVGQVDAVFTPTDNVVMAAAAAVSETLTKGGIPFYTGADSFVTAGAASTTPSWAPTPPTWRSTSSRPALSPRTTSWTAASSPSTPRPPRLWARTTPCSATWARWWKWPPPRTKHTLTAQYRQSLRQDAGGALA